MTSLNGINECLLLNDINKMTEDFNIRLSTTFNELENLHETMFLGDLHH